MATGITPQSQADQRAFRTLSGEAVRELYTPEDLPAGVGGPEDPIGLPGEYPFTRGVYPSMYRGRLWTMRQFAGFGTSEETNERFRYLLDHGQTGLSTAFDMPSLMGHDSDHARALGEVGREGVAVDTLDDMQTLFSGIDLGEVSVSMTINAPAAIMLAFYVAAAGSDPSGGRVPPGGWLPPGVLISPVGSAPPARPGRSLPSSCRARSRPTSSRSTSPRRSGASRSIPPCACAAT